MAPEAKCSHRGVVSFPPGRRVHRLHHAPQITSGINDPVLIDSEERREAAQDRVPDGEIDDLLREGLLLRRVRAFLRHYNRRGQLNPSLRRAIRAAA